MKSCPRCGKEYPDSEEFCETDGTGLVAGPDTTARSTTVLSEEPQAGHALECPVCGGRALPGEARCNYCGARLQADPALTETTVTTGASNPQGFAEQQSGPQEFGDTAAYAPEPDSSGGRRVATILGLSAAAVVALAAGAWFALYLGKRPSPLPPTLSPPIVKLANQSPLGIQGDIGGPAPRDTDSLRKAFEDNKAGLANVYGNTLASAPSMSDGMAIRLHILPDGTVDNPAVTASTAGNPSFDAEVVEAMKSWKFDAIKGSGVTADYRLIFAASAGAAPSVESELNSKLASLSPSAPPEYALSSPTATSAAAESSPSAIATPAAAPTKVAALPPERAVVPERRPTRHRVRRHRPAPPVVAAVPPPTPSLLERVNEELRDNRRLRRVQAYTNGSVVTIYGKVFDDKDRLLAERTVRNSAGVSGVVNNLTTDTQQWAQNQSLITQALQNAGLNDVAVKVIGGDAYLSGQVKTKLDRERAVTVAQAAAPIKVRENLITVAIGNMFGF